MSALVLTNSAAKSGLPFPTPANSGQYAADLDEELGGDESAPGLSVLSAWVQSESATFPGFNGLGTTLELPGSTPVPGNSANVQEYPTLAEGLTAARDMMLGESPQTTPLAAKFVADLDADADTATLTNDVLNSGWDGAGKDTYDATAIASKLGEKNFSTTGSSGSGASTAGISLNPLTDVKNLAGDALSATAGTVVKLVGIYVLKGIISLTGAAIFVYGAKLTTERGQSSSSSSGPTGAAAGAAGSVTKAPEELADAFPEAALAA